MTPSQKRLMAYLDRLEPSLRRDVARAIERLRAKVTLAALVDVLERVDLFALNALTAGLSRDLRRATAVLAKAIKAGAAHAHAAINGSFTLTNREAIRLAGEQAAKLVTNVSRETRTAIRVAIQAGFADGLTPREIAALIRPVIGLTERQAQAAINRRAAGMTAEAVAKYADRLLKQRALMIARTEIIAAATEGQIAAWKQAQADGFLSREARKQWMVTPDDRLCQRCAAMDGQSVPIAQSFTEGTSTVSGPPLHPNCRCTIVIDAKSLRVRRAA